MKGDRQAVRTEYISGVEGAAFRFAREWLRQRTRLEMGIQADQRLRPKTSTSILSGNLLTNVISTNLSE